MRELIAASEVSRVVDLRRRIHRVIDFIDENLDADLSIATLADIARLPPRRLHRAYDRIVGQPPDDTIRRLRLLQAAHKITRDGVSLAQASETAGFASRRAFERAYEREFARNPMELRMAGWLNRKGTRKQLPFTIVERPDQRMLAVAYNGIRAPADALTVEVQGYVQLLNPKRSSDLHVVYHDDLLTPFDQPFRCDLCFRADFRHALPQDHIIVETTVAGGLFACIEQRGRLFDLAPLWPDFVRHQLPSFGWTTRPGPVLRRILSDRAATPPSQRLAYLYLPVQGLPRH